MATTGKSFSPAALDEPARPSWAHEYMRYVGDGAWVCDGCPLESCDCDSPDL